MTTMLATKPMTLDDVRAALDEADRRLGDKHGQIILSFYAGGAYHTHHEASVFHWRADGSGYPVANYEIAHGTLAECLDALSDYVEREAGR